MIEENMLRGSLTSTNEAKGGLGYKGERGYSNYEIYVKNGGTMTEEEWLDHFGVDLTGYAKTSEVDTAVNAVKSDIGDLEELETVDKTDIVSAINELKGNIEELDNRDVYSTSETIIGKHIDGNTLYAKTYIGSITQEQLESGNYYINSNLNVDFVRISNAEVIRNNSNHDVIMNNTNINTSYFSVFYRKENNTIQFRGNGYYGEYNITLEYTKAS